jgi:hypothetical protein
MKDYECGSCGVPDNICDPHQDCVADVWHAAIKYPKIKLGYQIRFKTTQGGGKATIIKILKNNKIQIRTSPLCVLTISRFDVITSQKDDLRNGLTADGHGAYKT